ncbi:MAG: DUF1636 domain-containing protein [Pseudomonadota bacterium]
MNAPVELLICATCKRPDGDPDAPRPGAVLAERVAAEGLPEGVSLRVVECLSNCSRGCTVALRGGPRWTYVYGNFAPEADVPTLLDGVARYAASADGLVPWRERPEHFKRNCIARIPPLEAADA